jgi:hypothetical protein
LGIPYNWSTVEKWLNPRTNIMYPPPPSLKPLTKKCPDVATLKTYYTPPPPEFWKSFPSLRLPSQPASVINVQRLAALIHDHRNSLPFDQRIRADRVVNDLQYGSAVLFSVVLPAARTPNNSSVVEHGEEFTDTLAWWIRKYRIVLWLPAKPYNCSFYLTHLNHSTDPHITVMFLASSNTGDSISYSPI